MAEKHEVLAESRGGAHQLLGRLARKEKHLDKEVSFSELATQGLPNSIWHLTLLSLILQIVHTLRSCKST